MDVDKLHPISVWSVLRDFFFSLRQATPCDQTPRPGGDGGVKIAAKFRYLLIGLWEGVAEGLFASTSFLQGPRFSGADAH